MTDIPLFDRALTPAERREIFKKAPKRTGLHAAEPGTGPAGETCGSCANLYRRQFAKTYLKCALTKAAWTRSGSTDVKARDPACAKWQAIAKTEK